MGTTFWTMTTKRKKRTSNPPLAILQHPRLSLSVSPCVAPVSGARIRWIVVPLILVCCSAISIPTPTAAGQPQTGSHAHDFVIFATVFTDKGFALPGARARVRREDEKKFRWEAMSDRQGEFGIRVKQGAEYELTIEARGFKPQTRKVDAREGDREDLTLQMEQVAGGKP
jgi:hypothetical protein